MGASRMTIPSGCFTMVEFHAPGEQIYAGRKRGGLLSAETAGSSRVMPRFA
jgi:hypothetical protein